MFKKMMKTVLAIAFIGGIATAAHAEAKIGGSVKANFGQMASDVEGSDPYLIGLTEANVQFKSEQGPMTAFVEMETLGNTALYPGAVKNGNYKNTKRAVSYQISKALGMKIGTVNTGVPFSVGSGLKTHQVPGEFIGVYHSFAEADGLNVNYKITDGIKAELTFYGSDVLQNAFGSVRGSATQFGAAGSIMKGLAFKLSSVTSEDIPVYGADPTADVTSSSAYNFGIKYSMDILSVSLDLFNKVKGDADPATGNAIQVKAGAGPGKVVLTIANRAQEGADTIANTVLAYQVPVDKKAGFQVIITSQTTTPPDTAADTTATTDSYFGGGFYAAF